MWKWRELLPNHQEMSHHQVKMELGLSLGKVHGSANRPISGCVHTELKHNISTRTYRLLGLYLKFVIHWQNGSTGSSEPRSTFLARYQRLFIWLVKNTLITTHWVPDTRRSPVGTFFYSALLSKYRELCAKPSIWVWVSNRAQIFVFGEVFYMSGHVQYFLNKSVTGRSLAIWFLWKNIFLKMCLFKKRHI